MKRTDARRTASNTATPSILVSSEAEIPMEDTRRVGDLDAVTSEGEQRRLRHNAKKRKRLPTPESRTSLGSFPDG